MKATQIKTKQVVYGKWIPKAKVTRNH